MNATTRHLADLWPLFGLLIETPRLQLRLVPLTPRHSAIRNDESPQFHISGISATVGT